MQIGVGKPNISIAPGVRISGKPERRTPVNPVDAGQDMHKLSRRELRGIRDLLLDKREQLLHGMKRELENYRARAGNKLADEADKAADAYDEDLSFEIASTSEKELGEIESALDKIKDGSYGQCETCSQPISPSRLKILPFATACKACRAEKERRTERGEEPATWNVIGDNAEETK